MAVWTGDLKLFLGGVYTISLYVLPVPQYEQPPAYFQGNTAPAESRENSVNSYVENMNGATGNTA